MENFMARPVRAASICRAPGKDFDKKYIFAEMDRVGKNGCDIIVTPEVWTRDIAAAETDDIASFSSPDLDEAKRKAAEYGTYIVACMGRYATPEETRRVRAADTKGVWKDAVKFKYNSCFLIDRTGKIQYIYDKAYPYMPEFALCDGVNMTLDEMKTAPVHKSLTLPGNHVGIFECDFGTIGLAICFDINFPQLWQQMGAKGAELVLWPSAFSGGRNASLRAGTNNYYVISCTCGKTGDCRVCDVTGDQLIVQYPSEGSPVNTVEVTLNLDRTVFHKNFNEGKIAELLEKYPGKIGIDRSLYDEEEWLILWSLTDEFTVKQLCSRYGLVPLREFRNAAVGGYIDSLRENSLY